MLILKRLFVFMIIFYIGQVVYDPLIWYIERYMSLKIAVISLLAASVITAAYHLWENR